MQSLKNLKDRLGKVLLVMYALVPLMTTFALAAEDGQSRFYGTIWSLIPPIVAIVLALITKEVYSSLFLGILVGYLIQMEFNPVAAITTLIADLGDNIGGNAGILIFLVVLGTMVAL